MSAVSVCASGDGKHKHRVIIINRAMLHSVDEEVVLVHVYLDAGGSSVEILQCLRTMLRKRIDGEDRIVAKEHSPVRASFSGHLCDMRGRTNLGYPSQMFHSTCQSPLESEWVTGHRTALIGWRLSYLLSVGEINFLCDNHEPPQNDSNLTAAFLSFLLQRVESRYIVPRELIVVVYEIVRCLCPFAMLMNGFKLLALLRVRYRYLPNRSWDTPIRTAVRPTSFILVSMVENDCPTDYGK